MEHRQTVLKLAFDDNLSYVLGEGFRTPNVALPFKALEDIRSGNFKMAHLSRETSNQFWRKCRNGRIYWTGN